jgi:hypothetical protein
MSDQVVERLLLNGQLAEMLSRDRYAELFGLLRGELTLRE